MGEILYPRITSFLTRNPMAFFGAIRSNVEDFGGAKDKKDDFSTYLDVPDRLGSMVRINGLFHLPVNGVFIGVITH